MSTTFDTVVINDLEEFAFIGGTQQLLYFDIYDDSSQPIPLNGMSCYWKLSPYGQPTYAVLNKTGVFAVSPSNRFLITLTSNDTKYLSGKFAQQPYILVPVTGGSPIEYRPSQGIITIIPRIETI